MVRISCLAGIDRETVPMFIDVLKKAGVPPLPILAKLKVVALSKVAPDLLICDVDGLQVDPLETLRQIRFVLPDCSIVVYTRNMLRSWSIACHLAGANGLLSKDSSSAELASGVRGVLRNGCFTDPRFLAA